jgi:hypothetical protein
MDYPSPIMDYFGDYIMSNNGKSPKSWYKPSPVIEFAGG